MLVILCKNNRNCKKLENKFALLYFFYIKYLYNKYFI